MTTSEENDFPPLETERLTLRLLAKEDTDFVFKHFGDVKVNEFLMDEPPLTEYAQAEEIVQFYAESVGKTFNRWVIIEKFSGQLIGTCGFHKWDKRNRRSEIGYDLSPDYWRKGYMTEALSAVIANGFDRMRLNRIEAQVYIENEASVRLLQKLGFQQEALLRDYYCVDGIFYDHYLFSLIKRDREI